jgi:hypothetical protein
VIPYRVGAGAVCIEVFNLLNTSMRGKGAFQTLTAKINLDKARKSVILLIIVGIVILYHFLH